MPANMTAICSWSFYPKPNQTSHYPEANEVHESRGKLVTIASEVSAKGIRHYEVQGAAVHQTGRQ